MKLDPLSPDVTGWPSLIRKTFKKIFCFFFIIAMAIIIIRVTKAISSGNLLNLVSLFTRLILPILHKLNNFHVEQISTLAFLQILIENLNSDRALGKFASFEDFGGIRCKARQVWLGTTSTLQ